MFKSIRRGFFRTKKVHQKATPRIYRQSIHKNLFYTFLGGTSLLLWTRFYKSKIEIKCTPTDFNQIALSLIPELFQPYMTTLYLPFRLWELTMGARLERRPYVKTTDSYVPLPDGDRLEVGKILTLTVFNLI